VLLLLGGFWMALLLGWRAPDRFLGDLEGCGTSRWLRLSLLVALRWVAPPALALGLVASLTDLIGRWLPG
jgi:NSS family neurotransmitter:Na+ symporter